MHSSTQSFSSSEETAVVPDDGLFNRKVEEEKMKEHVTRPRHFPSLPQLLTPRHQTPLRTLHQWHRVLLQVYREETRCCTTRDQRRDAVECVGCHNTISRRAARIYHCVATSKHHRIFRLLEERWDGVGVHRRKDTVRGHSPEINSLTYIHSS